MRRWTLGVVLALMVIMVLAVGGYYLANSQSFPLAGSPVARIDTTEKLVALTLDDGPTALGDEIGNHTYTHPRMVFVSPDTVAAETVDAVRPGSIILLHVMYEGRAALAGGDSAHRRRTADGRLPPRDRVRSDYAMTSPLLHGLPPIIGDGARVLILGNMPSAMSLAAQQYYGNPRNAFWRITGEIFGFDADAPYEDRTAELRTRDIAVWDVLRSCRRVGSLDSAVESDSMVPNDFRTLFDGHRHITSVFFNGAAAEKNFGRLVPVAPDLKYQRLPSTSPANTVRYMHKLNAWREAITARQ